MVNLIETNESTFFLSALPANHSSRRLSYSSPVAVLLLLCLAISLITFQHLRTTHQACELHCALRSAMLLLSAPTDDMYVGFAFKLLAYILQYESFRDLSSTTTHWTRDTLPGSIPRPRLSVGEH